MYDHPLWGNDPALWPPGTLAVVRGVRIDANKLRAIVERRVPTVREFAARVGVDEDRFSDWFAGRSMPQPATLHRVLTLLRVDLDEVLPDDTPISLETLRWRAGMTRQHVASAAHLSKPRYAALETGELPATDRDIRVLAAALHATEDEVRDATRRYPMVFWGLRITQAEADELEAMRRPGESRRDFERAFYEAGRARLRAERLGTPPPAAGRDTNTVNDNQSDGSPWPDIRMG